ncbi:coenzyme F420-0:L-glutamate ligase [Falsiroseomonas oryzae]|uniref:coenzyme F420-0:L-glutamate ligase n=1 Tax=Falsiroseomonas oryzae TaxID=2766473 RepID=UPI0022EB8818|nr:coenzyme F420-0:L-glutamate ligase [Roseomonas sp. MO-31]
MRATSLAATALPGLPEITRGADLAGLLAEALRRQALRVARQDVLVVAQKIVSKAEGRVVRLADVLPSPQAVELADRTGKDARLVEVILSESRRVVRAAPRVLVVEHRLGFVMANAGVDQSNVADPGTALLLPQDPDASAARLRDGLAERLGTAPAVIVSDSFGRAWRRGSVGTAIGVAGMPALLDLRGQPDRAGRPLEITTVGFADQVASAAALLTGEAAEGRPAVLVQGLDWEAAESGVGALLRPQEEDLFR